MSNTCYIFLPLFLFHCFSEVATNFTVTSQTSVILLLFKSFPSNETKNLLVKIVKHKLDQAIFDGIRGNVQLEHFIFSLSQLLNNFLDLTHFTALTFSINCWNLTAILVDNS